MVRLPSGASVAAASCLSAALSKLPLDQEIPEKLYRAVAEVLSYILRTADRLGDPKR